ncbi:MAG: alpha/beta fold hydrolase [Burkholderiales bacterium]
MSAEQSEAPVRAELPNGVELHFIEKGQGPAVILLHGGMGDCKSWVGQIDALAENHRVIAYSRRHSHPNRNFSGGPAHKIATDVDDLLELGRHLRIGSAHLVGTSYGALVALVFALAHPDSVLSLILAEPPLHQWARRTAAGTRLYTEFMDDVWGPAAKSFDLGDERRAMQLLTDGIWGRPIFDSQPSCRGELIMRNAAAMRALTRSPDPFPDLQRSAVANVGIPTLLVHGEQTSDLHRCVIDELGDVMPIAARVEIPGAGHGSAQENRDGFRDAVLDFLNSPMSAARLGAIGLT